MSNILVTGAAGSLMSAVIPHLKSKGHQVWGQDINDGDLVNDIGDLRDSHYINHIVEYKKPEYIIQGAAQIYGVKGFHSHGADILGDDITLHRNILRASVDHKVKRVIFISSSMVYERSPFHDASEHNIDNLPVPQSGYGLSKFVNEKLCKEYRNQYGLEYTIWRPFNIITPYEKVRGEMGTSHVFADFLDAIVRRKVTTLDILGDGQQVRCFTDISEVSKAIAEYSFLPETKNEHYNLGRFEPITMLDLARMIHLRARVLGIEDIPDILKFNHLPEIPGDVKKRRPAIQKTQWRLFWTAQIPLQQSIDNCIEYIKNNG